MFWRLSPSKIILTGLGLLILAISSANAKDKLGLTKAEQSLIWERGTLSGQAERCGLDWAGQNFLPMMRYWRRIGKNEKETAIIAALHGGAQSSAKPVACTPANIQKLRSRLKFKK
ncbi:MAG: hypothetical protein VYD64_01260 [Pseudomonadota bacterium]|nr:hypothetical protein [Pseudomonadota bacterium]